MNDQYIVIGNPIAHSKSPFIHAQFAKQTGQQLNYHAQRVAPGELQGALDQFKKIGGKGANITAPFKLQALEYVIKNAGVQNCSERAKRAGAVNTIKFQADGSCWGDNTDGVGLIRDITQNLDWQIHNKRILLLGAGGAARGVLALLLEEQPAELIIANRTPEKAYALAGIFSDGGKLKAYSLEELADMQFDLVINSTAAGLQGEILSLPTGIFAPNALCYDMVYGNKLTVFLHWAQTQGCIQHADGLGMLVEQAAESFSIWRGVKPDTQSVIKLLRG